LRRQKHAHKEQDRNFLPEALTVDIDFSQNFVHTDRIHAIQSDHWKSSSTTIFVAVVRYLSIAAWNRPAIALKKGQSVSNIEEADDGGGDVYVYVDGDVLGRCGPSSVWRFSICKTSYDDECRELFTGKRESERRDICATYRHF
jgi:hypothetical protein